MPPPARKNPSTAPRTRNKSLRASNIPSSARAASALPTHGSEKQNPPANVPVKAPAAFSSHFPFHHLRGFVQLSTLVRFHTTAPISPPAAASSPSSSLPLARNNLSSNSATPSTHPTPSPSRHRAVCASSGRPRSFPTASPSLSAAAYPAKHKSDWPWNRTLHPAS